MTKFEDRSPIILENHGQKIFGVIHRPLNLAKAPAVMMCHGFAGHKVGRYRLYVKLAEKLVRAGIIVLRFDFRGSGDSEGELSEMTIDSEVSDALVMLNFLAHDPQVDRRRIGLFGRSLGGVVAIISATMFEGIKSLALWSPAFSGEQWQEKWLLAQNPSTPPEHKLELRRFDGSVAGDKFLKQLLALRIEEDFHKLEQIPLLHIHGEKDDQVNITHADQYSKCRSKARGQTKMVRLPHSDHDFSNLKEQAQAIDETWKWFQETL